MSYRRVIKPRFYINVYDWAAKIGGISSQANYLRFDEAIFSTLPVNTKPLTASLLQSPSRSSATNFPWKVGIFSGDNKDECAVFELGHTFATKTIQDSNNGDYTFTNSIESLYNGGFLDNPDSEIKEINSVSSAQNGGTADNKNGFSLKTFKIIESDEGSPFNIEFVSRDPNDEYNTVPSENSTLGSIAICSYYTMPKSPEMSITLSWEYGGSSHKTSIKGNSISNTMWSKPPMWGNLPPWELIDPNNTTHAVPVDDYKSGRRVWDLKFPHFQDSDLWGSNQSLDHTLISDSGLDSLDILTDESLEDSTFQWNIMTDDNFFSQVWQRTLGGSIPFIFQPDSENYNPDQFAICRIKDNSLKADQIAPGLYSISLEIEEVW
tara:strand:- start:1800 stop:2936 length:1137 start_codon:yes stop_codon:yes gene_type:complete